MSKYIIEFSDKPSYQEDNIIFYPCKQIPWWSVSKSNIDKLTPLDKALEEAYQRGLNDAWEAARKIVTWPDRSLINSDTFDLDHGESVFTKYSASKAIAKLKAYEEQKADDEIKVGDEVEHTVSGYTSKAIFLEKINDDEDWYKCLFWTGCGVTILSYPKRQFKRTGRHFDIDKILEEMKE